MVVIIFFFLDMTPKITVSSRQMGLYQTENLYNKGSNSTREEKNLWKNRLFATLYIQKGFTFRTYVKLR